MTKRSHFGDLQFLHAMGAHEGEMPYSTRDRFFKWLGVMFKLAYGNQGVSEYQPLRDHFPELFSGSTSPSDGATLRDLILSSTPEYRYSNVPLRALGICLHIIEDSYAIGHVQRRLMNPQDFIGRDSNRYLNFRPGTWGQWGPIVSFHTYGNQDDDRHSFYDGLEGAGLPNPKDLGSFNRLHGARDAIEACIILTDHFAEKQPWDKLRQKLRKTVFAVDRYAKPCNFAVDDVIPGLDASEASDADQAPELDFESGLQYKISTLESGLHDESLNGRQDRRTWFWNSLRGLGGLILLIVIILQFFATRHS